MSIESLIATGIQPVQIPSPLAQASQLAQLRNFTNQNELARYTLGKAQQEDVNRNALADAYRQSVNEAGDIDYSALTRRLAAGGAGNQIAGILKTKSEGEEAANKANKARVELLDASLAQSGSFLTGINPADPVAPQQFADWIKSNHAHPVIGPELRSRNIRPEQAIAQMDAAVKQGPQAVAQLLQQSVLGVKKFMELNKSTLTSQTLGGTARLISTPGLGGDATVVPGSVGVVTMTPGDTERLANETIRIRQEGQRLGLEGRRVVVAEETARLNKDPEFQQRMEAARTTGRKTAEGDVAAVQTLPRTIARAEQNILLIDELIGARDSKTGKLMKGARPHPGFENAVGATWLPGARFVPGTDAAGFMTRFDQIKGASFLEAFEILKGGGSITEKEGAKGTDAINRMSIAGDEKEFVSAALDLQAVIRKGVQNAQARTAQSKSAGRTAPTGSGLKFLGFENQ